jgi:hypothetical protein
VAIEQARSSLGAARKRIVDLKNAMARLEVRDANADARLQVAKLTNAITGAQPTGDSELQKAVRNYEERVTQKERRGAVRLTAANGAFRIDYAAMLTEEASGEIERVLSRGADRKPIPPVPAARPSAAEAVKAARR